MCTKQSQPSEAVHKVRFCPFRGWPGSRMGTQRNMTGAVINNPLMSNENKEALPYLATRTEEITSTIQHWIKKWHKALMFLLMASCYMRYRENCLSEFNSQTLSVIGNLMLGLACKSRTMKSMFTWNIYLWVVSPRNEVSFYGHSRTLSSYFAALWC